MSRKTTALCCAFIIGSLAACAPGNSPKAPAAPVGPTAGTFNGNPISQSAVDAFLSGQFRKSVAELSPQERERGLDGFAQMMALAEEAKKLNLAADPEIAGQLQVQEMSTLARALITSKSEDDPIDDAKVQSAYEALLNTGEAREYNAKHILLETEEAANAVIVKLDGGADFVELAKTESTGPSGPNGGDLGWFGQGRMVEPFFNATVALESGSYTKAPVETQFGWHVILLEQTRDRPFEEAEQQLRAEMQREWIESYVESLQNAATVEWNAAEAAEPTQ